MPWPSLAGSSSRRTPPARPRVLPRNCAPRSTCCCARWPLSTTISRPKRALARAAARRGGGRLRPSGVKEEGPVTSVAESPDLLAEKCVACRRDAPRVTTEEMAALQPFIPVWTLEEDNGVPRLVRTFRLPNFHEALVFTQ